MPLYTMPMCLVIGSTLWTLCSSYRMDFCFFSVARTTPLEAENKENTTINILKNETTLKGEANSQTAYFQFIIFCFNFAFANKCNEIMNNSKFVAASENIQTLNKCHSLKLKLWILKAFILSIKQYSSTSWSPNFVKLHCFRSLYLWCQPRVLRLLPLPGHIRSGPVSQKGCRQKHMAPIYYTEGDENKLKYMQIRQIRGCDIRNGK